MLNPPDLGLETMDRDTVWKQRKSPYRITESFLIVPEATLTIDAGVEVRMGPNVSIHCQGRIVAQGTEQHPIAFRSLEKAPWDKIDCVGGKVGEDGRLQPDLFRNCIVEGGRGIRARDTEIHVESSTFRDNVDTAISLEFSGGRVAGNEIYGNSTELEDTSGNGGGMVVYSDREVVVEGNDVHDNISSGGRDGGGGIYAYAYDNGRVSILNNRIWRNRSDRYGGGLVAFRCEVAGNLLAENVADDSGGGIFALGGKVEKNRIESNHAGRGGGMYSEGSLVRWNSLAYNTASPFMGGGLFYYADGRVEENTFYGNGSKGEEPGEAIVVSGGPVLRRNNIVGSLGYALRVQTHSLAPDLDAGENFWGTRDPEVVISRIHDWLDDAERGLVDWHELRERWIPDAPPPPPDFLTVQAEGEGWVLRWMYPPDVPVSGFRVHCSEEAGLPRETGQALDGRQRQVRLARPFPEAALFYLSAYREQAKGEIIESALARPLPVPTADSGNPRAATPPAAIRAVQPNRSGPSADAVSLLRAVPDLAEESRAGARWVISEIPEDFSTPLFDSGPVKGNESLSLPDGVLRPGREYAWRVAFQGTDGNWSDWSPATRFCTPPAAAGVVEGPLRQDTVFGKEGGATYTVSGNMFVPRGVKVELLPGTKMEIARGANFRVRGDWIARGEPARAVLFTGDPESPWGHLFFEGGGEGEAEAPVEAETGPVQVLLQHCVIEHGMGVVIEGAMSRVKDCVVRKNRGSGISIRDAAARIEHNRIVENRSPSNGGGIYAYGSKLIYILDNEILENEADEDGGGVFGYGYRSNTAVNLSGNRIERNRSGGDGGGVWLSRSAMVGNRVLANEAGGKGGGLFATFALIEDNEISGNGSSEGGGIYAETNSSLEKNRILDNRCSGDHGGGVFMNFWGMSIKNEVFRGNTVTRNSAGTPGGSGGVYLNGSMIFEYNRVFGNQGVQLFNADPSDRPPLAAPHCYWGTARAEEVEAAIHHAEDDPGLARVLFEPFAARPGETEAGRITRAGRNP
jgi:hypothetical protein